MVAISKYLVNECKPQKQFSIFISAKYSSNQIWIQKKQLYFEFELFFVKSKQIRKKNTKIMTKSRFYVKMHSSRVLFFNFFHEINANLILNVVDLIDYSVKSFLYSVIKTHCGNLLTHLFGKKFRENNVFTKEITKELIWRNIFCSLWMLFFCTMRIRNFCTFHGFYKTFSSKQLL